MAGKILVTGATGNIGGEIVRLLKEKNADFVAATNSRSIDGVDSVALNFADTQSLEAAMQGVSTLFMVLANHPDMLTWGKNVIDTAKKCGVKHIVRSSGSLADGDSSIGVRKALSETNQHLKESGIDYTITAPGFFMQNFINFHGDDYKNGALYLPAGDGKVAWVDVRDIAAVNVAVLLDPEKYCNLTLTITGSKALSYAEAVAVLNSVLGKDATYVAVSDEDARKAMAGMEFPEFLIDLMIDLNLCIRKGFAEETTTTVKEVTGQEAISFEQFVCDNTGAWL
ncbi:MAG: SDR family oxidoreductase [Desulfobacterales bacterium]|nr:SDR family oxidoreductase [Desulfobacterales bacterium]